METGKSDCLALDLMRPTTTMLDLEVELPELVPFRGVIRENVGTIHEIVVSNLSW